MVEATIPREQIVQAQTPQGFRYGLLSPIFNEARIEGFQGTDEASLVERAGQPVYVVMGSPQQHQDHHSGRSGAGRVLPLAGAARASSARA